MVGRDLGILSPAEIDGAVEGFCGASTQDKLLRILLGRWERDYGWEPTGSGLFEKAGRMVYRQHGWVIESLMLLNASQHGLTEHEVTHALSHMGYVEKSEVVNADWQLFLQASGGLIRLAEGGPNPNPNWRSH